MKGSTHTFHVVDDRGKRIGSVDLLLGSDAEILATAALIATAVQRVHGAFDCDDWNVEAVTANGRFTTGMSFRSALNHVAPSPDPRHAASGPSLRRFARPRVAKDPRAPRLAPRASAARRTLH